MKKIATFFITVICLFFGYACKGPSEVSNPDLKNPQESKEYEIVFVYQDGTNVTKTVEEGETLIDIPQLSEITGYNVFWDVTDFSNITSNVMVREVVEAKTFKIHYDLGECPNAVIAGNEQLVKYDENYQLYIPYCDDIAVYDYQFVNWITVGTEEVFSNGKYTYEKDIYLVAVWEKFTPDF